MVKTKIASIHGGRLLAWLIDPDVAVPEAAVTTLVILSIVQVMTVPLIGLVKTPALFEIDLVPAAGIAFTV